jgi:hypothetical protein
MNKHKGMASGLCWGLDTTAKLDIGRLKLVKRGIGDEDGKEKKGGEGEGEEALGMDVDIHLKRKRMLKMEVEGGNNVEGDELCKRKS